MWKSRLGYAVLIAGSFILLFFYGIPFLLYAGILLAISACGMFLFLRKDAGRIQVDFQVNSAGREGDDIHPSIVICSEKTLIAAGYVLVNISVHNEMFDSVEKKQFFLKIHEKENLFEVPVSTNRCGEVSVSCDSVKVYDLFKLFGIPVKGFREVRTVIYPHKVKLKVEVTRNFTGAPKDEGIVQNRKGNDPSEMFDIREYVPGDDVRSIHWKLSSKTDTLVLRESSDPSHYSVVILPDFGLDQIEKNNSEKEVNTAVGIGAAVCRQLIQKGIPFGMAFPSAKGLKLAEIRSRSDFQKMMSEWLSLRIQSKAGAGLQYFTMEHMEQYFTRLLILSAGHFEQNLGGLDGKIGITVLNASADRDAVLASRNGTCEIIEIPADNTGDTVYRIIC